MNFFSGITSRDQLFSKPKGEGPLSRMNAAQAHRVAQERADGIANLLLQNAQMLEERGDKLDVIENKSADMKESSKAFVDTVKEYNRREVSLFY